MTFRLSQLEELADWCNTSSKLAASRADAWTTFFGEDDPRPVDYWPGAGDRASRERRFLGWFMFCFTLVGGRRAGEIAAEHLYRGTTLQEALRGIRESRYVLAIVRGVGGRSVFLELENERFELRSKTLAQFVERNMALVTHLVPSRPRLWIPGPGWMEWPVRIGPNMRGNLKKLQPDPIEVERLLQQRSPKEGKGGKVDFPRDDTLQKAVARMTEAAMAERCAQLVLSPSEWERLVTKHLNDRGITAFAQEIYNRAGDVADMEALNRWLELATNIWNNTPQPDRGGKTANELAQESPGSDFTYERGRLQ